jgi:hypothetical protein
MVGRVVVGAAAVVMLELGSTSSCDHQIVGRYRLTTTRQGERSQCETPSNQCCALLE